MFINKDSMCLPTVGFEDLLGKTCNAYFVHIKHLYALQEAKTLKIAHKLNHSLLNPNSISRTSPRHALSELSLN